MKITKKTLENVNKILNFVDMTYISDMKIDEFFIPAINEELEKLKKLGNTWRTATFNNFGEKKIVENIQNILEPIMQ